MSGRIPISSGKILKGDPNPRSMGHDARDVPDFHVEVEFEDDRCYFGFLLPSDKGFPSGGCLSLCAWARVLGDARDIIDG